MLKKIFWGILIVILVIVGYYAWRVTRPVATQKTQAPIVDVVVLKNQEVYPEASFVAKIESQDKVALRARVSGFLQERLFQEGDIVKKDQPLFIIERVNYESAVKSAEANYVKAVAAFKNATSQYDRVKKLYQTKDVSKAKLDEAEAALEAFINDPDNNTNSFYFTGTVTSSSETETTEINEHFNSLAEAESF